MKALGVDMSTLGNDPLWVASIHLTNQVIGERMFAPVLAAALREYADSLDALRPVANFEAFVSTNGTSITAAIGFCDGEPVLLQSGSVGAYRDKRPSEIIGAELTLPQLPLNCSFRLGQKDGRWEVAVYGSDSWEIGCAGDTAKQALERLSKALPAELDRLSRSKSSGDSVPGSVL